MRAGYVKENVVSLSQSERESNRMLISGSLGMSSIAYVRTRTESRIAV